MLGRILIAFAVASVFCVATHSNEPVERLWRDSTLKFQVNATLTKVDGESVQLRTRDGRDITVAISKLSEADRQYLAALETVDDELVGKVVRIVDGDTIVLLVDEEMVTIRLEGITNVRPGKLAESGFEASTS